MNRKQFMQSQGATCNNWGNSWSFVNHDKKEIIFGLWDHHVDSGLILSDKWERSAKYKRKAPGYRQAIEHIRLITEQLYQLKVFVQISGERDDGCVFIKEVLPQLQDKVLYRAGVNYYAYDVDAIPCLMPDEILDKQSEASYLEGQLLSVLVNQYERNPEARRKCIEYYNAICQVCDFSFDDVFGRALAKGFIHVHHVIPVSSRGGEYEVDPIKDLRPVCPNCHAMIHKKDPPFSIEELRVHIKTQLVKK